MLINEYIFLDKDYFPCVFIGKVNTIVLLWCSPPKIKSHFLKTHNNSLVYFISLNEIEKNINQSINIHFNEIAHYDILVFFSCLNKIKPYKEVHPKDCSLILNELNILEDILFTLSISNHYFELPRIRNILEKLFYGCNLPSLEHPEYYPTFKPYDIKVLKQVSHKIWRKIIKKEPIFK